MNLQKEISLLTLYVGEIKYSLDITDICNILDLDKVKHVPNKFICGEIDYNGFTLPVIDLGYHLHNKSIAQTKFSNIIIVNTVHQYKQFEYGLLVTSIGGIIDIQVDDALVVSFKKQRVITLNESVKYLNAPYLLNKLERQLIYTKYYYTVEKESEEDIPKKRKELKVKG